MLKKDNKQSYKAKDNHEDKEDDADNLVIEKGNKIKMSKLGGVKNKSSKNNENVNNDNNLSNIPAKKPTLNLKDIETIKNYIHDISKNTNPIGKLIDNLQDDVECMNKELNYWKNESSTYNELYEEELKKSEEILFPLEKEYLELEDIIKDEVMRIKSIKSNLLTNEHIIQNLINGVISVKNLVN